MGKNNKKKSKPNKKKREKERKLKGTRNLDKLA